MRKIIYLLCAAAFGMLCGVAESREARPSRAAKPAQIENFGERALININNMSMWFRRDGYSAGNPYTDNSGVTYPRSTDQVIYRDGLIWGGRVLDGNSQEVRVGGQAYEIGTVPGRIVSKGVAEEDGPGVRVYRIRRDYRTADLRLDAAEMLNKGFSEVTDAEVASLRAQYDKDWREWPMAKGAPFYDRDRNGRYEPRFDANGNPDLTGDEPGVAGADQVAWFVLNDLDEGATTALYGSLPIGLEVQVTLWGYARTDALGDVVFKKYTVIYKGTSDTPDDAVIRDMYFAQFSDPDLGDFGDDFAGCDVELSLGYVYNSVDEDSHYQAFDLAPPAAGYDFLQGPIVPVYTTDEAGNQVLDEAAEAIFNFSRRKGYHNLPMTSFVYFAAGSSIDDPEQGAYNGTREWYNLLRGFQPQEDVDNPVPFTDPQGNATFFTLNGDPIRATGWNDGVPLPAGDRRIVLNTGPFEMALGDTQEVVVALLGGIASDRLRSVSKLKFTDQFVQEAYNNFFEVPAPPQQPAVRVDEGDRAITIDWGFNAETVRATEKEVKAPFRFEGYNLYQFPSAEASISQAKKIATYDVVNGVTTILGKQLDDASGVIVDVPLQIGNDAGLQWVATISRDAFRSGPLLNGQPYYFSVTAYSYNPQPDAVVATLESTPQKVSVVPQMPHPGIRRSAELSDTIQVNHVNGAGDATVLPVVVAPSAVRDATYTITFNEDQSWNLVRSDSRGDSTVLGDQQNYSLDDTYFAADGVQVKIGNLVFTTPTTYLRAEVVKNANSKDGDLVFWGDGLVFGNPDGYAATFWEEGGTQDENLLSKDLEFRFTGAWNADSTEIATGGSMATLAGISTGSGDRNIDAHPFRPPGTTGSFLQRIPFEVWDVDDPTKPRQLNVAFLDRGADGSREENIYHKTYNMTGRDYITVIAADYDSTKIHELTDSTATWVLFFQQGGESVWSTGDVLQIKYANRIIPGRDEFQFITKAQAFSLEAVQEDVKKVNVFPNPYYGVNESEVSRYTHFVTFSHLPRRVKIRIFDLSGTLVRTLDETDKSNPADQFLQWNLSNDNELPVASGLYIAHIEMPEVNKTKILKLAIVQEQQFLENY